MTLKSSLLVEGEAVFCVAVLGVAVLGVACGEDGLADELADKVACFFCSNCASSETGRLWSVLEDRVLSLELVDPSAERDFVCGLGTLRLVALCCALGAK